jgi:hypothetical protein
MSNLIEKMLTEKLLNDKGSLEKALANILVVDRRHPSPEAARAIELTRAEIGKPPLWRNSVLPLEDPEADHNYRLEVCFLSSGDDENTPHLLRELVDCAPGGSYLGFDRRSDRLGSVMRLRRLTFPDWERALAFCRSWYSGGPGRLGSAGCH